ncbi:Sterol uptake control protein [Lachnellula suecica]|uniref:Sterol uptake control protein n=1 Tax=Lachnellula suecica TaxID=602035 RepID=A0A8T9CKG7_9HELO|nr:Sterol uptake control protein [Lachnellula suecica]
MANSAFITKRPHKKSRGGCQNCKQKKVKCDEAQPICTYCLKRDLTCGYVHKSGTPRSAFAPSPSISSALSSRSTPALSINADDEDIEVAPLSLSFLSSPPSAIAPPVPCALTSFDLRMMHHWSTVTWSQITTNQKADTVLLLHAPQLGFEHDFLLNCILGISSLHMESLNPGSSQIRQQANIYRARALQKFRENLPRVDPNSDGFDASLLMAILLIVLCSKGYNSSEEDITVVNWLVLYRGLASVVNMRDWDAVEKTVVYPLFVRQLTPLRTIPVIPTTLLRLVKGIHPLDPDFEHLPSYCGILDAVGILYAGLRQDGTTNALFVRIISCLSFATEQFTNCAREKRPRALIILAHYLVFLKLIPNLWWLEWSTDGQIKTIMKIIGPSWSSYMNVPLQAVHMTNPDEVAALLLR